MVGWDRIARDNLKAAQVLADECQFRSCVSRAYYAAFSAATSALTQAGVSFDRGRETPPHRLVPRLVQQYLASSVRPTRLREPKATIRRLYNERIQADYRCGLTVDGHADRQSRRDAHSVCLALGVIDARRS